jgi:signal peptidase
MCQVKRVKSREIFPVIQELLNQGGKAWITVTGTSMFPFLREERDSVQLVQASYEDISKGDIVLILRKTGYYVLHRVIRKKDGMFFIIGDAQRWIEGPLLPRQLIARVESVKRGNRIIRCNTVWWRTLTGIWLNIVPLRFYILRGLRLISRLGKYFKKQILDSR